jgi:hypothetical protein
MIISISLKAVKYTKFSGRTRTVVCAQYGDISRVSGHFAANINPAKVEAKSGTGSSISTHVNMVMSKARGTMVEPELISTIFLISWLPGTVVVCFHKIWLISGGKSVVSAA